MEFSSVRVLTYTSIRELLSIGKTALRSRQRTRR